MNEFLENELLKKFPDEFRDMIIDNATARNIFMSILHGESPYNSIFRLLQINIRQFEVIKNLVETSVPSGIVYDKEAFNKLKLYETQK